MRGRCGRRGTRRKCRYWMPVTIHVGVNLWPQNATWETLRDHALLADRLGFDSLWVWDHFYSINGDLHRPNLEVGNYRRPTPRSRRTSASAASSLESHTGTRLFSRTWPRHSTTFPGDAPSSAS